MIWLTWRQLRTQTAVVYAALLAVAIALAATAAHVADLERLNVDNFAQVFENDTVSGLYPPAMLALLALPAIIGVFWGAPLVSRELEAGTHRLAWNQTVTRTRWLAVKLGGTGLVALAGIALVSVVMTWWAGPLDTAIQDGRGGGDFSGISRVNPWIFVTRGIVPVAYAAFALTLGVTAGMVLRRTVTAMALTLAVYVVCTVAMAMLVRPHLGPVTDKVIITQENFRGLRGEIGQGGQNPIVEEIVVDIEPAGAWVTAHGTFDPTSGRIADTLPKWVATCLPPPPGGGREGRAPVPRTGPMGPNPACLKRLADEGYRAQVSYQPTSRFWTLQAIEAAIFAALAALLTGFSFWWLRRVS